CHTATSAHHSDRQPLTQSAIGWIPSSEARLVLRVDPRLFLDAVAGGPLDTGYLHAKSAALLTGDLTPSFALSTALKDTRLILEAAEQAGVRLDLTEASAERFARAEAAGHGAEDMIATYFAGRAKQ
ncbi:NAD-binding protein, partial [Streptomyces sp. NPDC048361]|uniref:NAD-binding protein n=1 Tax=Streptomyces sp. NPDC048361 TaxID=3154720 RepID=UPI0034499AAF